MKYKFKLVYAPKIVNQFQIEAYDSFGERQGYLAAVITQKDMENCQRNIQLQPNQFFAKTYSENASWVPQLLVPPYFHRTGAFLTKFFPTHVVEFPLIALSSQFIMEQFEETYNKRHDIYEAEPFLWTLYDHAKVNVL